MAVFIKVILLSYVLYAMFTTIQLKEQTFFKDELTWFEAQRCCASRLGQLASIDDADGEIVNCHNIPSDSINFKIWSGNIRRHSEWIEFQGCILLFGVPVRANNISECYQSCLHNQHNSFEYFAFKGSSCICNPGNATRRPGLKTLCNIDHERNVSWFYRVLYNASFDGYGNCVASKCTNGSQKKVAERCESLQIPMCGFHSDNGVSINSATNWNKSQSNCKTSNSKENNATDICELNTDTTVKTGIWTNIFRVEISSHIDQRDMNTTTDVSSCLIAKCLNEGVKPRHYYTNCNETADAFFCIQAHNNTIMSSGDCKSQTTNTYNRSKPHTITEATISSSVSRYTHQFSNRTQNHYSTEVLTTVNTVFRSVDVISTHKPSHTITNITPTMDQHVGNKPEATNIGLICGVTVSGVVLIAVIVIIACKMRKVGPFRKRPIYENTIEMNSVDYAIPAKYDTVLNTDNGSVPNVYINSDTGENQYDRID